MDSRHTIAALYGLPANTSFEKADDMVRLLQKKLKYAIETVRIQIVELDISYVIITLEVDQGVKHIDAVGNHLIEMLEKAACEVKVH